MTGGVSGRVLLVRHPPVATAWAGRCYGRSDMGWSREGQAIARALADRLAAAPPAAIVHSGLRRTRRLAELVARRQACPVVADPRWAERDFGDWEGRTWRAIWRETGNAMDGMVHDPTGFRPGGGETGLELSTRVLAGWADLPPGDPILVVAHGGSIAAIRCALAGDPFTAMADHIVPTGTVVTVSRRLLPSPPSR